MEYSDFAGLEETKTFESSTFGSDFRALCTVLITGSLHYVQTTDVVWRFFGESCDVIMSTVDAWSIDFACIAEACFHCVYEPSAMDMIRMGFIFQSEAYHVFWEVVFGVYCLDEGPKNNKWRDERVIEW